MGSAKSGVTGNLFCGDTYTNLGAVLQQNCRKLVMHLLPHKPFRNVLPSARLSNPKILKKEPSQAEEIQRKVILSSAALGLTTLGAISFPVFGFAALPLIVYLRLPSLKRALIRFIYQQRLEDELFDSAIVLISLSSGYWLLANLHICMNSLIQLHYCRSNVQIRQRLIQKSPPQPRVARIQCPETIIQTDLTSVPINSALELEIPVEEVIVNDRMIVCAGEWVPADGTVISGVALVEEYALNYAASPVQKTGSPMQKTVGDRVYASSLVLAGSLVVNVDRIGTDSIAGQIISTLQQVIHPPTVVATVDVPKALNLKAPDLESLI